MAKKILCLLLPAVLAVCVCLPASASVTPYANYSFDFWGNPVEMPACYTPSAVYLGQDMGAGELENPQDVFVDDNRQVYIVDAGNNRLLILDEGYRLVRAIDTLIPPENGPEPTLTFNNPSGVFVAEDGLIYLADTDNKRVVVFDQEGNYRKEFTRPSGSVQYNAIDYLPIRVVVDHNNYVYVVSRNTYQGLILYNPDGGFEGYFAANETEVTFELLMDRFWKNFLTDEQRAKTANYVSIEYSSVDIDKNGFMYTTTLLTQTDTRQLSKINPSGDDVMPTSPGLHPDFAYKFGDLGSVQVEGTIVKTKFTDVCYDEEGFINVLDYQRGRIFQYSDDGSVISVFGGIGNQAGTFQSPAAIEMMGHDILVLDSSKNNLTVFSRTAFGEEVQGAVIAHREGEYAAVKAQWEDILGKAGNYSPALIGIGKAYYEEGDYSTAMEYFRLGQDRENYGKAYKMVRNNVLRVLVPWLCLLIMAVFLYGVVRRAIKRWRRKPRKKEDAR